MENNTICSECGTENEPAYDYCKNCGALLLKKQSDPQPTVYMPQPAYQAESAYSYASSAPYSQNIPTEDLAIFIGKKAHIFLPKFMSMDLTGSKASWCWPVAVLSFFLGPIGAAFWFLYRKMYKIGIILLGIGVALDLVTSLFEPRISLDLNALPEDSYAALRTILGSVAEETTVFSLLASFLESAAKIASCVLTGIFGMYLYKQHCIKKITAYRQSGIDMRYYKLGLAAAGGTSGGYLALGIFVAFAASGFGSLLVQFLSVLS